MSSNLQKICDQVEALRKSMLDQAAMQQSHKNKLEGIAREALKLYKMNQTAALMGLYQAVLRAEKSLEISIGHIQGASNTAETWIQKTIATLSSSLMMSDVGINDASQPSLRGFINQDLAGKTHPESGVPFENVIVTVNGNTVHCVAAVFSSKYDTLLPSNLYFASDYMQFKYCIEQLNENLAKNPSLKSSFSSEQLSCFQNNELPDEFTWHHDVRPGRMQLVDTVSHETARHTGGRAVWGGGSNLR